MKTIKSLTYSMTCAIAAGLLCVTAQAADTAGTVVAYKGEISAVDAAGASRELGKGDTVNVGDTVRTGMGGYMVIEFIDGARATIRPNSEVSIDQYAFQSGNDGAVVKLLKGGLRTITGGIARQQPESYKVKTNVATLGVRGTEFYLQVCDADCS